MKKFIYISGIASANFMFLGSIFKVQHWPGANIMLVISVFLFCFLFLPFGLYESYKNNNPKKYGFLYVVSFVVFFIVFISALFKVLHWPGAGLLMVISLPLPFVLFLPVYLYHIRKDKNYSFINFMGIMFGLTFLAVFSSLLSLNVSRDILNNFEKQFFYNQELVKNFSVSTSEIDRINPVKQKADDLCQYIEDLKSKMLAASENKADEISTNGIRMLDNSSIAADLLKNDEKYSNLNALKDKIVEFKNAVISSGNVSKDLKELSNALFSVEDGFEIDKISERRIPWEEKEFTNYYLIIVLDALTRLESNVKFITKESMKQ